jgi:aconitate hydratase
MAAREIDALDTFEVAPGRAAKLYSLSKLEASLGRSLSRLPAVIRIVLESVLRNIDGKRVHESDLRALAGWEARGPRTREVPFVVARVLLQDFTGVPLLVDLAAMRSAAVRLGRSPERVEPLVPVDLVIDHSVQVDYWGTNEARRLNLSREFERNEPRYRFLKWGMQAFDGLEIVPPGIGICHQVNLEYLSKGVVERDGVYFPDTLVGTDSHTTMVNGLGVLGWGVGGIEAEAAMLGQPIYMLEPDVVGVRLEGKLREGVTATDLVLRVTEMLRKAKVVGRLVEFHGEGAASLDVPERAILGNMAPEYGATAGFFPVDEKSCEYLLSTGRSPEHVDTLRRYCVAQALFGIPKAGERDYTTVLELDLSFVKPSVAGPKRPQDRIELDALKQKFTELLEAAPPAGFGKPASEVGRRFPARIGRRDGEAASVLGGGGRQDADGFVDESLEDTNPTSELEMLNNRPTPDAVVDARSATHDVELAHGDVLIAAITSCTNTSNPSVMLGAGILAKKAVERGLSVNPKVKTSLAPGSRRVSQYLERSGLQASLDRLGFNLVGFGCTTCIGNSGPLDRHLEDALQKHDIVAASVLSGNRNFEARIHQSLKANFLMSPPLVVAFAIAGKIGIDLTREPLGAGKHGEPVYLRDIWPTPKELAEATRATRDPEAYRRLYSALATESDLWNRISAPTGNVYQWEAESTYIQEPPYFAGFGLAPPPVPALRGARALAIFGDSVTTDHISPAGAIKPDSAAGRYLQQRGVAPAEFNSYGSRRGNHEVMIRGTFANVRIKNLMVPGSEGGITIHQPSGEKMTIYDAAMRYQSADVPLLVFAGQEYGSGSSRDWAAKGTRLLGVRAVVASSFERIHRSNLVGMGVLPCQFKNGTSARTLGLDGSEELDLLGVEAGFTPQEDVTLVVRRRDGRRDEVPLTVRIDTPIEIEYFQHGGIMPFVLRRLLATEDASRRASKAA